MSGEPAVQKSDKAPEWAKTVDQRQPMVVVTRTGFQLTVSWVRPADHRGGGEPVRLPTPTSSMRFCPSPRTDPWFASSTTRSRATLFPG
jgi:hypothetical protein